MPTPTLEKVTSRDGTAIACHTTGEGPPLVLVHGTSADHTRWRPLVELLAPHVTVVAIDRRGRGASGDGPDYSIQREAEDVAAVVDALAEATGWPVDVLGHSYGAWCALEAALLTAAVRRLVLYEAPVVPDPSARAAAAIERVGTLVAEDRREDALATFFTEVVGMADEELARFRTLPAWRARLEAAHTLARECEAEAASSFDADRFADLAAPTLLLDGEVSPAFLRESTRVLAAALPDSRVDVLPGQAHVAIDTATEMVADLVLDFLGHRAAPAPR